MEKVVTYGWLPIVPFHAVPPSVIYDMRLFIMFRD